MKCAMPACFAAATDSRTETRSIGDGCARLVCGPAFSRSAGQSRPSTPPESHERTNGVPARQQLGDEAPTDVTCAAGDEDVALHFTVGRHSVMTRSGGEASTSFESSV